MKVNVLSILTNRSRVWPVKLSRGSELVHYWGRVGEGVYYWGRVGEGEFCQRWRIVRSNKQGEISNEIYNTVGITKTKQKNKVFGCEEHTMEVVLKVVALVELVALVKPLSVGRVVPSCGGTKVNDNRKMSSGYDSKSQHNTTQHNREKTRTIHTANRNTTQRNTTGKRQEHNMNRNATQLEEHNMTKLKTDMQRTVELVDGPKTPRKNLVKKRCTFDLNRVNFKYLN